MSITQILVFLLFIKSLHAHVKALRPLGGIKHERVYNKSFFEPRTCATIFEEISVEERTAHHKTNVASELHKRQLINEAAFSCSRSLCDFPEITAGYGKAHAGGLLQQHTIPLKVVTFAQNNGNNPHATANDTLTNVQILQRAFNPVGIAFNTRTINIPDSNKWSKFLVIRTGSGSRFSFCRDTTPESCRSECKFEEFGWDHGTCLCSNQKTCTADQSCVCLPPATGADGSKVYATPDYCDGEAATNGQCDQICNNPKYQWDHGDCCKLGTGLCFDFDQQPGLTSLSSFVRLEEVKSMIDNADTLLRDSVVLVVMPWARFEDLLGVAGLPWSTGTPPARLLVVNSSKKCWGNHRNVEVPGDDPITRSGTTAVHELGHTFGLLHTFAGVEPYSDSVAREPTKQNICQQPCSNNGDSEGTGDFCADTPPTPENDKCADPIPCAESGAQPFCSDCKGRTWGKTLFTNVMGYANDECISKPVTVTSDSVGQGASFFTEQQSGRIRCHIDLFHTPALTKSDRPSMIVIAPAAASGSAEGGTAASITVSWVYPVNRGNKGTLAFVLERDPPFPTSQVDVPATAESVDSSARKSLSFEEYVDTAVQFGVKYAYRVRPFNEAYAPLSFSPWSASVAPVQSATVGCPGNCHGHGACNEGKCQCAEGWEKRDAACRLPNYCDRSNICTILQVGDGKCDKQCEFECEGEKADCTYDSGAHLACETAHPRCTLKRQGDGICHDSCNNDECRQDFGDCVECGGACLESWLEDGHCSEKCRRVADCKDREEKDCAYCNVGAASETLGGERCATSLLKDGICDAQCNNKECRFDEGDCPNCAPGCVPAMLGNGRCDPACSGLRADGSPQCGDDPVIPDSGDCTFCDTPTNLCLADWVGDGNCDMACANSEKCQYDLLDCKGCACAQVLLQNGQCDEACNTEACENDGGECEPRATEGFPLVAVWASLGVFLACFCCLVLPLFCCVLYLRWQRNTVRELNMKANQAMMSARNNSMSSARNNTSSNRSNANFGQTNNNHSGASFNSGASFASSSRGKTGGSSNVSLDSAEPNLYPSQRDQSTLTTSASSASTFSTLDAQQHQTKAGPRAFARAMSVYGAHKLGFKVEGAPSSMPGLHLANEGYESKAVTGGFPGRGASSAKPDF